MHKAFIYNAVRIPTTPPFGHPSFPKGGEFELLSTYEIYSFRYRNECAISHQEKYNIQYTAYICPVCVDLYPQQLGIPDTRWSQIR